MLGSRSDANVVAAAFFAHGARQASRLWFSLLPALTSLLLQGHNMSHAEDSWTQSPHSRHPAEARDAFHLSSSKENFQSSALPHAMIHKLPPEILGEIFSWCIPTHAHGNSSAIDSAPLVLLRVCRSWRRVALGTPQLWTQLHLYGLQGVNPAVFIATWLRRSGALPLDVYINPLSWNHPINLDFFKKFIIPASMRLLAAEFHRIRTFHTTNFPAVLDGIFPENKRINAPLLRDFRITSSPKTSGHALAGQITAPSLAFLEISDPHLTLQSITVNFHNLLSIRWNGSNASQPWHASLDHLVPLLQACPNLEECEVLRPWPFEDFFSPRTTITLPRLRRLSLMWKENVAMTPLLNILELPALQCLRLEMDRTTPNAAHTTLQRTLNALFSTAKPTPPLTELHATHLDTSAPGETSGNIYLLPQFRALERLRLEDCSIHSAFLTALTPDPSSPSSSYALPSLKELYMERAEVDGARVARFVASRRSSLEVLSLHDCGGISPMDRAVLRAIADHGGLSYVE